MLKKLFKYDWILTWRVPTVISAFLILLTLIAIPVFKSTVWQFDSDILDTLAFIVALFYVFSIFVCPLATFFYMAIRYYKNLYTDEGYLTATLPADPWQLVLSKLLVSFVWNIISGLAMTVSIMILIIAAEANVAFAEVKDVLDMLIIDLLDMNYFTFTLSIVVQLIASMLFSILMMFSSIALGQLFTGHRVAGAVIWYIIQYMVVQFVYALFINAPLFSALSGWYDYGGFDSLKVWWSVSIILTIIADGVLFFICEYMLRKKLNLE